MKTGSRYVIRSAFNEEISAGRADGVCLTGDISRVDVVELPGGNLHGSHDLLGSSCIIRVVVGGIVG